MRALVYTRITDIITDSQLVCLLIQLMSMFPGSQFVVVGSSRQQHNVSQKPSGVSANDFADISKTSHSCFPVTHIPS